VKRFVIFLIAVFLLCGCASEKPSDTTTQAAASTTEPSTEATQTSPQTTQAVSTTVSKTSSTTAATTSSTLAGFDRSECDAILDPETSDLCLLAYSRKFRGPSICASMKGVNVPEGLTYKDHCYMFAAADANDPSMCELISSPDYALLCRANVSGDMSICGRITDQGMQCECYNEFSALRSDLSICEGMKDENCRGVCYYYYAVDHDDPTICERQNNADDKDSCYMDVGRKDLNAAACSMVFIQSAEMCLSYVAEYRNNASICEQITSSEWLNTKMLCLAHVTNDTSYCDQMKDQSDRAGCREYLASGGNYECNQADAESRAACTWKVAVKKRDSSICDKISVEYDFDYKGMCYAEVAGLTGDIKACSKIKEKLSQKSCYESFVWDPAGMFIDEIM
jgi:hypothetical protein